MLPAGLRGRMNDQNRLGLQHDFFQPKFGGKVKPGQRGHVQQPIDQIMFLAERDIQSVTTA